ncbi:daunorubicin resistance protein DrrA family ABC transporter ATP-binding protein [Kineosporia sp. NBRC 101677]|uniref:ABC transporter ATP-binding protein n=1 Tax=Kineosporia sp. NBRC 101677 TaxID=3032197 RepID=UPI0024A4FBB8|nr:ATP-binding cassette domain-containing protein [Kineosporia sp. NBRC 101677]GLY13592.1 daunorubicin resistance protein DrrA family ABC transporter ATP-binding protein [Kineosporia sp. NBRC 101677]
MAQTDVPPASPDLTRELAIDVRGLRKSFGDRTVLDGIDLAVGRGTVFALLGPNGAGKTTIVNILATLLAPDAGVVRIAGHDLATQPARVRSAIGLTGQFAAIDDLLTGAENLTLMGKLHHLDRAENERRTRTLLGQFGLTDVAHKLPTTYSGGMRRKLDLAMGLMGRPHVVFLDEPTTGLDPRSRREMWDVVRELVADGVTVLLTTQYLEEADQLADRIALLDGGKIVAEGTEAELKRLVPGGRITLRFADQVALARAESLLSTAKVSPADLSLDVMGPANVPSLRDLLNQLEAQQVAVDDIVLHTPDLDDVFLALTGQPATTSRNPEAVR